jgi:hypothetical protein
MKIMKKELRNIFTGVGHFMATQEVFLLRLDGIHINCGPNSSGFRYLYHLLPVIAFGFQGETMDWFQSTAYNGFG